MKNLSHVKGLLLQCIIIIMLASIQVASAQAVKEEPSPIPDDILKIFKASCIKCHSNDGGIKAKTKLNFSTWAEYDSLTAGVKALDICSELLDGAMPPKSARESNPQTIPTTEQTELICNWSETLKANEGE